MLHLASTYGMHLFIICIFIICIMRSLRVPNIISWGPSTLVLCWAYFHLSLSLSQSKSNWMIQAAGLAIIRIKLIFFAASMSDKYIWFMDSNKRRQYSAVLSFFIHFTPFLCGAPLRYKALCLTMRLLFRWGLCCLSLWCVQPPEQSIQEHVCVFQENTLCNTLHSPFTLCNRNSQLVPSMQF